VEIIGINSRCLSIIMSTVLSVLSPHQPRLYRIHTAMIAAILTLVFLLWHGVCYVLCSTPQYNVSDKKLNNLELLDAQFLDKTSD
jgi:hypothetical protein